MTRSNWKAMYTGACNELAEQHAKYIVANTDVDALRTENAQLRKLVADHAHQSAVDQNKIAQLKAQLNGRKTMSDYGAAARKYCEDTGARSVTRDQLYNAGYIA